MTVIPDSIEPVEAWRAWRLLGGKLVSITNGVTWKPGQPLKAKCAGSERHVWRLRPHGLDLERAAALAKQHNEQQSMFMVSFSTRAPELIRTPSVEPPPGYGYSLEAETHDAPDANCTCGIYAASEHGNCPAGDIVGKVKLWGKVIPGEYGYRAEYAYPSELHVPPKLLANAGLVAYGVPLVEMSQEIAQRVDTTSFAFAGWQSAIVRPAMPWQLKLGIAMNAAACAFNLLIAFKVIHV